MYDVIIIGGGFYGCMLALHFRKKGLKVILLEKEANLILKASLNNQARIHNGYHYPRSYLTALSSHRNYTQFIEDFEPAVDKTSQTIYAIAKGSKTNVNDFIKLYKKIGSPLKQTPPKLKKLFNKGLIEETFLVEEKVFNAKIIRDILQERLHKAGVEIKYKCEALRISEGHVYTQDSVIKGHHIINCTYAEINTLLKNSSMYILPFKLELTEMPLISVPNEFKHLGVTIMDGPYFAIMPFPSMSLHTIHHVSLTPRTIEQTGSNFDEVIKSVTNFIPSMKEAQHRGSICESKTVLLQNEEDDGRPILFKQNYGVKGFDVVLGAKIDNVYDVIKKYEGMNKDLNILT